MRKVYAVVATAVAATAMTFALATGAGAQEDQTYTTNLGALNGSGASGTASVTVSGNELTVEVETSGVTPDAPHAQHLHVGGQNTCPTASADTDGDGLVSTPEGQPSYGGIRVSLTTEGDVSADSGLAVDRFPVADAQGNVSYSRTFDLPSGVTADEIADAVVVQHGIDLDDSGTYDGDPSPLDSSVAMEATIPALCGALTQQGGGAATATPGTGGQSTPAASPSPGSGVQAPQTGTGAGSGGGTTLSVALIAAAAMLVAGGSALMLARRGARV